MPLASRWLIRCSFIYLLIGFIIGALLLVNKAIPFYPQLWTLLIVHIELLIFGWIIQLTLGTAHWMFPKYLKGEPRGPVFPAMLMVALFNGGILLVVCTHLFGLANGFWLVGRCQEALAVALFTALHWQRVTTYRHT